MREINAKGNWDVGYHEALVAPATSDAYITQRAPGSPLLVGAVGGEGLFPTLGTSGHHPLLPCIGFCSFTYKLNV